LFDDLITNSRLQQNLFNEEEEKVMIEQTEVGSRDIQLGMFYF
jgi:hypothetical protein